MLKPGNIVRCDDHDGLWLVKKITKGKAFKDQYYASIEKILEDDFSIPSKKQTWVYLISMCHREYNTRLFENIFSLQNKITNLAKAIKDSNND